MSAFMSRRPVIRVAVGLALGIQETNAYNHFQCRQQVVGSESDTQRIDRQVQCSWHLLG